MENNVCNNKDIAFICDEMKRLFDIELLVVFGIKRREKDNAVTDLDICVVCEHDNKNAWIKKAYLEIDSDIPFDISLYTPSEWNSLIEKPESFASRILRKGCVVYGKTENQ